MNGTLNNRIMKYRKDNNGTASKNFNVSIKIPAGVHSKTFKPNNKHKYTT